MKELFYTAPELDEVKVSVEYGFSMSGFDSSLDYGDGGDGELLD